MDLTTVEMERDALQRQVNELLNPPKQKENTMKPQSEPVPNSWTFTPKSSELPVDNAEENKNSKYYIKKP